jgi:UDP-glucose 4-epimerase
VHSAERLSHRVYNLGGGRVVSNAELAAAVRKVVPEAQISLRPGRNLQAARDAYMALDRIRQDTGYEPAYDIGAV